MKQLAFIAALMLASAGFHPVRAQSVTLYTAGPESLAKDIAKAFGDKAGIKVEVYQATSGDVLARLEAEKAKPRADVAVLASWGEGLAVRERGLVDTYASPEAKKLRPQWSDGGLAAQGGAALALIVNSDLVKKDQQPDSWFDLAALFWKNALTMPDPTLSGSAAEFLAIFVQTHGDKAWKFFADLARNGLLVPGPNNAALNPVLTGAKKATLAGVDYITYGQIAKGEKLAIHYPKEGTVVALRPVFVQQGAPHRDEARKLVDFMLSDDGQKLVAKTFLIPARSEIRADRPLPGDFKMIAPDWAFVRKNQSDILNRFRKEIVEQIIQKR
ncbi:MAG TPA: extracellular solute-binding protein [Candidatus Binatia bacterium]|nr:extracellular solute-binding protein [Candidatus Binatia bacterium]